MKSKYEMMFILELGKETETKEQVKEILKNHGGNLLKEEDFGIKTLAYKIKKREKGFYYLVEVEFLGENHQKINEDIRLNESILKYLCLIINNKKKSKKKDEKISEKKDEVPKTKVDKSEADKPKTDKEKPVLAGKESTVEA